MSMHTRVSSLRSTYGNTQMRIRNSLYNRQSSSSYKQEAKHEAHTICNIVAYNINVNGEIEGTSSLINDHQNNCETDTGSCNGGSATKTLQWHRNNFKPLHPELLECDDDEEQVLMRNQQSAAECSVDDSDINDIKSEQQSPVDNDVIPQPTTG